MFLYTENFERTWNCRCKSLVMEDNKHWTLKTFWRTTKTSKGMWTVIAARSMYIEDQTFNWYQSSRWNLTSSNEFPDGREEGMFLAIFHVYFTNDKKDSTCRGTNCVSLSSFKQIQVYVLSRLRPCRVLCLFLKKSSMNMVILNIIVNVAIMEEICSLLDVILLRIFC